VQQAPALRAWTLPQPGQVVTSATTRKSYFIGQWLAQGFFSHVFECTDEWGNRLIAKVLKARLHYEADRAAAMRELENLINARHPHITYIYDAFELGGAFYIIAERCAQPLDQMWSSPNYDGLVWIKPVARCLLQAVDFIHRLGMCHQDLHEGNVFMNIVEDEVLPAKFSAVNFKVGDLGLAKLTQEMDAANTLLADGMQPPEAIDPLTYGPLGQQVDMYHCGLLLMQVLLGRRLRFTREEILAGVPRQHALQLAQPYAGAIEKCLRRRVVWRTFSAAELWRDLNSPSELVEDIIAPQSPPPPPAP
jgi:serine/threonine-protein kinase